MKLSLLEDIIIENKLYKQMLIEANVANVKLPIGEKVTIMDYLKAYADEGLTTPEVKTAFIKKLSTFLMNDLRNLHALREVPPDAPEWAQQAVQTGQLMVFKPDTALNDKVQHIIHYLAAAEHDSKQEGSPDQKIFAQRELAGFVKAENLDLLVTKSNEYFKRGSRNTKRDSSGLEQTFDAGDGYIWYELKAPDAYAREGKVLQNCIGRNYTAESCRRDNTIIFILRDPKDNSVAAARVKKIAAGYELEELKGKQNKPPVEKYMEPSIKFLNKMKFGITNYAANDLASAGYFYVEGEFYNLPTAIKLFTQAKQIAKLPSGGTVNRITSSNAELMQKAYPQSNDSVVYEARNDAGEPQFCFYVKNHVLIVVKSSKEQAENTSYYNIESLAKNIDSDARNEMFEVLLNKDLVSDIDPKIRKKLFWNEKTTYNQATKRFGKVPVGKEHQLSVEEHKWDEYNDPGTLDEIQKVLSDSNQRGVAFKKGDIRQIYVMHGNKDKKFVFIVTKDGQAFPGVVENGDFSRDTCNWGYGGDTNWQKNSREHKDVKSLVNFANDKKLSIPEDIRQNHGILKDTKKGTYTQFTTTGKEVITNPKVTKYNFDDLDSANKEVAFKFLIDDPELKNEGNNNFRNPIFSRDYSERDKPDLVNEVDSIYRVDITYGVDKPHKFVFLVKGNTITRVDDHSKSQKWQNWDDFEKIANIINGVKAKLKLNLDPSAVTGSNEFKVVDGDLSTKSHDIRRRLEKKKLRGTASTESVDTLPFADGSKLVRMPPAQQAGWMRQGLGVTNLKGEVWTLTKPDGTIPFAYFVDNGKIIRVLRHHRYGRAAREPLNKGDLPTDKSYDQEALRYLKGAADTFGWKAAMPTLMVTPAEDDIGFRDLKVIINNHTDDTRHSRFYVKNGMTGIGDISKEPAIQRLIRFGLVKRVYKEDTEEEFTHTYWVEPTPAGIEAFAKLQKHENVDGLKQITGKPIDPEFAMPEKEEPVATPAAPREPRVAAPVGTTKKAMAEEKFREMQAAQGRIPTLGEFKTVLQAPPFSMNPLAAQTYYYATKKLLGAPVGEGFYNLDFGLKGLSLMREVAEAMRT